MPDVMEANPRTQEAVVCVHGFGAGPPMMAVLASRLRQRGYRVINWGYPSIFDSIVGHGAKLADQLARLSEQPDLKRIHLVAHSLGGIVARQALARVQPQKLKRMVMLASPNRGSPVATFFSPYLGKYCAPIAELDQRAESFIHRLGMPKDVEVGVIAAEIDHVVPHDCVELDCQTDFVSIRCMHTALVFRRDVEEHIANFLESGKFRQES